MLHAVHYACRLCTMHSLGGEILITRTTFADGRRYCGAKLIELFLSDRSLILKDFVANGVQDMFKTTDPQISHS